MDSSPIHGRSQDLFDFLRQRTMNKSAVRQKDLTFNCRINISYQTNAAEPIKADQAKWVRHMHV